MDKKHIHPHTHHRALSRAAAVLILLFAGTGAALAEERRGDRDGRQEYARQDRHGDRHAASAHRDQRRDHRVDRHRGRGDHRYDRHRGRRDHRVDRHRDRRDHRVDRHRRYDRHDRYRNDRYRHRDQSHRYYDNRYRGNHRYNRGGPRHRGYFDVPRAIRHDYRHNYRPYHHGRVYYSAHRHHHDVYRFPVYTEWGVEYYPHAYCEGSFFGRGVFRAGRAFFDININF